MVGITQPPGITAAVANATYLALGPAPSGGDDYAALAAAVAAVPSGGTLRLRAGLYLLATNLVITSNVRIVGEGRVATEIRASAALTGAVVTLQTQYASISDLKINANGSPVGLDVRRQKSTVERVWVIGATTAAIRIQGDGAETAHACMFSKVIIGQPTGTVCTGLFIDTNAYDGQYTDIFVGNHRYGLAVAGENGHFSNVHAWGSTSHGVNLTASYCRFTNLWSETNAGAGLYANTVTDTTVTGGHLWANLHGGQLVSCARITFTGVTSFANTSCGYLVTDSPKTVLTGGDIYSNSTDGVQISGASGYSVINGAAITVPAAGRHGINSSTQNIGIYSNSIDSTSTTGYGVNLGNGAQQVSIMNNHINGNSVGLKGIGVDTPVAAVIINGNVIQGWTQHAILLYASSAVAVAGLTLLGNVYRSNSAGLAFQLTGGASVAAGILIGDATNGYKYTKAGSTVTYQPFLLDGGALQPYLKSGLYYFATPTGTASTATTGAGVLRLGPFYVPRAVTITRIGAEVTTIGDAGSTVRLGVYADDGTGYPGALILDAGTIPGDAVNTVELTISQALTPGTYWVGAVAQGVTTTAPTLRTASQNMLTPAVGLAAIPSAGATSIGYAQVSVTGALPTTFSTSVSGSSTLPRVFVKVA